MNDTVLRRLKILEQAQATRPMSHSQLVRHHLGLINELAETGIVSVESLENIRNYDYSDGCEPLDLLTVGELRMIVEFDETEGISSDD